MSKKAPKKSLEKLIETPQVVLWRALLHARNEVFATLESRLRRKGYTIPRFQIMFHIYFDGPKAPVYLASALRVSKANISTFIKRMKDDGLIEPIDGATPGRPFFDLTTVGRKKFENLLPQHIEDVCQILPVMNPSIADQLKKIQNFAAEKSKEIKSTSVNSI